MIFSREGRPVVAVEAKARPLSRDFERTVKRQLGSYSTEIGTPWVLLVDPENTYVFRSQEMDQPVARLSTAEVLGEAFSDRPNAIGEQIILVALDRVVPQLKGRRQLLRDHPELQAFADAVAGAESTFDPESRG